MSWPFDWLKQIRELMTKIRFRPPPPPMPPFKLGYASGPTQTITGSTVPVPVVIQVYDANGVAVSQAGIQVDLSVPSGLFTLTGNSIQTNGQGTAVFSGLKITGTPGSCVLRATSSGLLSVDSPAIDVQNPVIIVPPGWGLPPQMPTTGFAQAWPTFDGSLLPTYTRGGTVNSFGMIAAETQLKFCSIVADAANPTGSGQMLRMKFPGPDDPDWFEVWPQGSGSSPSRWVLAQGLRPFGWRKMWTRMRYRFQSNWSQHGPAPSAPVIYDTLSPTSSSTISSVRMIGRTWTTDQWLGKYVLNAGKSQAWRIIGNNADTVFIRSDPQFSFAYATQFSGVTCYIADGTATTNFGDNTGTKLWFPKVATTAVGSGVVHGQAWTENLVAGGNENNVVMAYQNGVGIMPTFIIQGDDWDGVTTDGQGAIGSSATINPMSMSNATFGHIVRTAFQTPQINSGLALGVFNDVTWYMELNTAGSANGIFRAYLGASMTPFYESLTVRYFPNFAPKTVTIGGIHYLVPVPITGGVFDFSYSDMTFGGGLKIPQTSLNFDIEGFQAFGSP